MDKWHIGKIIKLEKRKIDKKDEKEKYLSLYYEGHAMGYHSHDIEISILEDMALSISEQDGEGFIYLYPEQVKHLKKILCGR